jgi:Putative transposase, YhgA-like
MSETTNSKYSSIIAISISDQKYVLYYFQEIFPPSLLDRVHLTSLAVCRNLYIDPELKAAHSDAVYRLKFKTQCKFIYIFLRSARLIQPLLIQ